MGYYSQKDGFCSSLPRNQSEKEDIMQIIIAGFDLKRELLQNLLLSLKKPHGNPEGAECAVSARTVTFGWLRVPWPLSLAAPRSRPAAEPLPAAAARAIFSLLPGRFGSCKAALRQPIPSGYADLWQSPASGRADDRTRWLSKCCLGLPQTRTENSSFHVGNGEYSPCPEQLRVPTRLQLMEDLVFWRPGSVPLPSCARGRSGARQAGCAAPATNGVFPGGNPPNTQLTNCWFSSTLNLLFKRDLCKKLQVLICVANT